MAQKLQNWPEPRPTHHGTKFLGKASGGLSVQYVF